MRFYTGTRLNSDEIIPVIITNLEVLQTLTKPNSL